MLTLSSFSWGCSCVKWMLFTGIVCRVIPVVSKDLRIKFSHNVFASHFNGQRRFSSCCCCFSVLEHFNPSQLLFLFLNATICFISGSCSYSTARKAFLFSLYNNNGYNPVKLTQYQNHQEAMYHCSSYGPTFGYGAGHVHDVYISDNPSINQSTNSYTRCGSTYSVPPGYSAGDCGFFTGALHFTPSDIEVFYEIGKYKNGAILFSISPSVPVISERSQYFWIMVTISDLFLISDKVNFESEFVRMTNNVYDSLMEE